MTLLNVAVIGDLSHTTFELRYLRLKFTFKDKGFVLFRVIIRILVPYSFLEPKNILFQKKNKTWVGIPYNRSYQEYGNPDKIGCHCHMWSVSYTAVRLATARHPLFE